MTRPRVGACFAFTLLLLVATAPLGAIDRLVPGQFSTIQAAIDGSLPGDRVLVSPGTYVEALDYLGKGIEVIGTGGSSQTFLALVSLNSAATIDAIAGTSPTSLVGFTISGGAGQLIGSPPTLAGGGIFIRDATVTLDDLVLLENDATIGGGVYIETSLVTLTNCAFQGNQGSEGGAIFAIDSEVTIADSSFDGNSVFGRGGAIHVTRVPLEITGSTFTANEAGRGGALSFWDDSDGEIIDCTITGNSAFEHGGGISLDEFSDVEISATTVSDNSAAQGGGIGITHFSDALLVDVTVIGNVAGEGGGVRIFEACPVLDRVTIRDNSADGSFGESGEGGGIYAQLRVDAVLRNVLVAENSAVAGGGGILWRWKCEPLMVHTTIADNSAGTEGGGILLDHYSIPSIWNSIVWGNTAPLGANLQIDPESTWDIRYSNVEGGSPTAAVFENIDADPEFDLDYRITECSPSIDAGTLMAPQLPALDLDGNPRVQGFAPDQGINELPEGSAPCFVRGDLNADALIDVGDVVTSLGYLFVGNVYLPCRDAADVDDDGKIDIADPIRTLMYLFEAGAPPPPPEPGAPTPDPTDDAIDCLGE